MSHPSDLSNASPNETLKRLTVARSKAGWLSWMSLFLAVVWWGAGLTGILYIFGIETLQTTPVPLLIAGGAALLLPGLLVLTAGIFAREQARSQAVNHIVFEAATRLLTPAEQMSTEAVGFAEEMVKAGASVDRSMGHALAAMRAISAEIGDERARLESVTYASADNARDLAERLRSERSGLELLARDLREQTELLNEAIPNQTELIATSAQSAAQEVALAEEALLARLQALEETGRTLAKQIATLDDLAKDASERNETLVFAIDRMEEKLEQSRKTVETASRAGELAAAAATTTGDRLLESVNTALDGAKQASTEIQSQALEATEQAEAALAKLREAGQETASAVRAAGLAARAESERAEPRGTRLSSALAEKSADISERRKGGLNGHSQSSTEGPKPNDTLPASPKQVSVPPQGLAASPSVTVEEDLFEANADRMARALMNTTEPDSESPLPTNGLDIFETESDSDLMHNAPAPSETNEITITPAQSGQSLSEIIADMEREERSDLSREETAQSLLSQLEQSGIALKDIFKSKDKRKIAMASRKGEVQRRTAINKHVGRQVERVRQRLRGNLELTSLARNFISMESEDALNALENTRGSSKNASARLATFLLLDAALD